MKMNPKKLRLTIKILAAAIAVFVIMAGASGAFRSRMPGGSLSVEAGEPIPPNGNTITVSKTQIPDHIRLSGTVHSERQIHLSARLSAFVEAVHVSAGDRVPEGQLLLELDERELREEQAAAQAALQQAETAFQRSERLLETNATTPQAHEAAESAYRAAKAQAERVNVMLTYARILAPIDGVVADRFVEAGDLASMGQPLLTIFDPASLRIEVPVPASLIQHFAVNKTFSITLDQEPTARTATVTEIVSAFDPVTRTRRVKLHIAEAGENVLPGMYGYVVVPTGHIQSILLPPDAIKTVGQLESVMLVVNDRLQRRLVRTGPEHDGMIRILSGLQDGDKVWIPNQTNKTQQGS